MLKFNPNPVFPAQPLFEISSLEEIPRSPRYTLYCDGVKQTVFHTDSFDYAVVVRKNREAFPVEVQVAEPVRQVTIRPQSLKLEAELKQQCLRFTAPAGKKLSIEFDGDLKRPLFLLQSEYVPCPAQEPTYFFRKGQVYNVGTLELHTGETAYLEEGSVVCGRIKAYMADHVSVVGNGVLYGAVWHKPDENGGRLMMEFCLGEDILVQGITVVDNGVWNICPGACSHVVIRDVNIMSRLVTGDGIDIVGCRDVLVEHCFIRSADDCIAIKACPLPSPAACCDVKDVMVRDCVFWNAEPGNALEIGYELRCREVSNIIFSDCDIIHCEYEGNQSGGVLTIHNADKARVHNVVYENIRIEDAQEKFVDIKILDSKYSLDRVRGEVEDIYFRDICLDGPIFPVSIIRGFEMHHEIHWPKRIHFSNVKVNGEVITSANQLRMVVELAHELEFEGSMEHVKRDY